MDEKVDLLLRTILYDDSQDNGLTPQPVQETLTNSVVENDEDAHPVSKLFRPQVPTVGAFEERSKARFEEVKKAARKVFGSNPVLCARAIALCRDAFPKSKED